ncbi:hypothetical protein [Microvirga sp. M2]|uniref:hypothetical protein n=1 Tax=Microvirga sp. M2 TaxID=3073270 RepID=UPI0039C024C0
MPHTNVATGTFPSRKEAHQAVQRLVSSGFAHNSIELHRHEDDDGYDLEIRTRPENVRRAKRLINAYSPMSAMNSAMNMGRAASGAVQSARTHPLVVLGAGLLAGFVLYNLIPRSASQEAPQRRRPAERSGQRARSVRR